MWAFYPETAGQTLESVDQVFVEEWEEEAVGKVPLVRQAQWSVVRKARTMRKFKKEGSVEGGSVAEVGSEGKPEERQVEFTGGVSSSTS